MDTALLISAGIALWTSFSVGPTCLVLAYALAQFGRDSASGSGWHERGASGSLRGEELQLSARRELREPARDRLGAWPYPPKRDLRRPCLVLSHKLICGPTLGLRARSRPRGVIRRALEEVREPASRLLHPRFLARLARRGDQHPPRSGVE